MTKIKYATDQESKIITFLLMNNFDNLCGLHNTKLIYDVFEKFKKDIVFLSLLKRKLNERSI